MPASTCRGNKRHYRNPIVALKYQLIACLKSLLFLVENRHVFIESDGFIQGGIDVSYLQANRSCVHCKQPYEPTTDEPGYLVSSVSEMLCPECRQNYSDELVKDALHKSVEKLCRLQERRRSR